MSRNVTTLLIVGTWVAALVPATAMAHLDLTYPQSRHDRDELKQGPCGQLDSVRGDRITTLEPGATIEVVFNEYVDHTGHFRIAFDPDGQDDFVPPRCLANCDSRAMVIETGTSDIVLVDGIMDRRGGGEYRVSVTLPDIECDNCTLQVIQVMTDKPPYTEADPMPRPPPNDPDDLYYHCADLVLARGAGTDAGTPRTDAGTSDGGTAGTDAGTPGADASTGMDGGTGTPDGGTTSPPADDDGCSAAAGSRPGSMFKTLGPAAAVLLIALFRRRKRRRA